jgi:hypothetical protein
VKAALNAGGYFGQDHEILLKNGDVFCVILAASEDKKILVKNMYGIYLVICI